MDFQGSLECAGDTRDSAMGSAVCIWILQHDAYIRNNRNGFDVFLQAPQLVLILPYRDHDAGDKQGNAQKSLQLAS